MKIRTASAVQKLQLLLAINRLKEARTLLRDANCPKTLRRVRLALTSAEGALRHMGRRTAR